MTVRRIFVGQLVVTLILVFGVWLSGYEGRRGIVLDNRAACDTRTPLDRETGHGWATLSERALAKGDVGDSRLYSALSDAYLHRAAVPCALRFPLPPLVDFR